MKKYSGEEGFPIWIVGDSPPDAWKNKLDEPLDYRHPTRHSIWTPIENMIQSNLYHSGKMRLLAEKIYIFNAVESSGDKPKRLEEWINLEERISKLEELVRERKPVIVLTLGSFSFELFRRILRIGGKRSQSYWKCKRMGQEFRASHILKIFS